MSCLPPHAALAALVALSATLFMPVAPAGADPAGRRLAEINCAGCHAIGRDDASTHPEAPAFRDLHERYPLEALEEAFVEGLSVGHPDMPEFVASPAQARAIIDYIATLSP